MITDESITALVEAAGFSLRTLILNNCNQLSDDGVTMVGVKCPDLTNLALSGCTQLVCFLVQVFLDFLSFSCLTDGYWSSCSGSWMSKLENY